MENVTLNNINLYRKLSIDNYERYCYLNERLVYEYIEGIEENLYDIRKELHEREIYIIVFSIMTIESFINDFIVRFKNNICSKQLDKISLLLKVKKAIKLITNKEYSEDSAGYRSLKRLVAVRNRIVHSKPYKINLTLENINSSKHITAIYNAWNKYEYGEFLSSDMDNFINTFDLILSDIKRLDGNLNFSYLENINQMSVFSDLQNIFQIYMMIVMNKKC